MKRIIILFLALIMLALVGCGTTEPTSQDTDDYGGATDTQQPDDDPPESTTKYYPGTNIPTLDSAIGDPCVKEGGADSAYLYGPYDSADAAIESMQIYATFLKTYCGFTIETSSFYYKIKTPYGTVMIVPGKYTDDKTVLGVSILQD